MSLPAAASPLTTTASAPPSSPQHSASSHVDATSHDGGSVRDAVLMRLVHEHQPFSAPHGTKGAVWNAIGRALKRSEGVSWQGLVCRNRVMFLLDMCDRKRAGKLKRSKTLASLDAETIELLEEQLLIVAKCRVEAQVKAKEKALVTATAAVKARDERDELAKMKAKMKERDEKRAAAVVAAAARAREAAVVNTSTVVAKRRKRKGVKTKEEKKASAAMFEVLRQSREEYVNQLRVQTAAENAAAEITEETKTPLVKKPRTNCDSDLHILRAVAKCSPFSAETKQNAQKQWDAVVELVMKYCHLKFPVAAVRDRCESLIKDFEANDCKKSTFSSGIVVADEERLSLLRVLRKEYNRHRRSATERLAKTPETSQVEKDDSAIEIEDDQPDEDDRESDNIEQWGTLEENRLDDNDQQDEQGDESLVADTQDEEEPARQDSDEADEPEHDYSGSETVSAPSTCQSLRKRQRSESGASPDADPAVGMDIEDFQLDDNSLESTESQDFTPRTYKKQRLAEVEQDEKSEGVITVVESREVDERAPLQSQNNVQLTTVIDLIKAEREERRTEFKAMLDLMRQQNADHRSECEREHERRTREQTERQQEMTALVGLLSKERKDRKTEMLSMMEAMNKDRDDRREEFKAMMALMTKMVDTRSSI